jgi:hypothetical protein
MYQTHYVPAYTNHLLHAMLTFVTLGMWFPVWFTIWLVNHNRTVPKQIWVNAPTPVQYASGHYGHQHWQQQLPAPTQQFPAYRR